MEKQEWHDLAKHVAAIVRYVKPLAHLEKIPEAIEAAQVKVAEIESAIGGKATELEGIKKQITVSRKELQKVQANFEAARQEQDERLRQDAEALKGELAKETAKAARAKQGAEDGLTRFVAAAEKRKAQIQADIASAEQRLSELTVKLEERKRILEQALSR